MAVTQDRWSQLPDRARAHLKCPIVDRLEPIAQKHQIEGLVIGAP